MTHLYKSLTIARYTLLGAYRNRTLLLSLISVLVCWLIADFASALALTESQATQLSVYAFTVRVLSVLIACLLVINSLHSEFADRQLSLLISLDLPRPVYIIGKLAGFIGVMLIIVLLALVPLLLFSSVPAALTWTLSLFLELTIVASFSLFVICAIRNNTLSFIIVLGFYVLSRLLADILLLSQSPIVETKGFGNPVITWILQMIYVVLPDLWNYTRSEWLIYGDIDIAVIYSNIMQTLIAGLLLTVAAIFDFYRKNI